MQPYITALLLGIFSLGLATPAIASEDYLSGYSGSSGGHRYLSGYSSSGNAEYARLVNGGDRGRIVRNFGSYFIDRPHEAEYRRRAQQRAREREELANIPLPCGNYGRAPAHCFAGE